MRHWFKLWLAAWMLASPSAHALKILTFNTWLLDVPSGPFGARHAIAEDMNERLKLLPMYLAKTEADIVLLQEVWSDESKRMLVREMRRFGYRYAVYTRISHWFFFFNVEMGDGLVILSKFPIRNEIQTHTFSVATQRLEKFTKKGVIKVEIEHPTIGGMDVYVTHTGAVDFENGKYDPEQISRRSVQIRELAAWIRETRTNPIAILGADLNLHYQKWAKGYFLPEYQEDYAHLIQSACGFQQSLQNTYLEANRKSERDPPTATFSSANPYVKQGYFGKLPDEVEDYLFVCEHPNLKAVASRVVFRNRLSDIGPRRLSDHFGILSEIEPNLPASAARPFLLTGRH